MEETWQKFGCDTEAGRLLRQVYSKGHNKPLTRYPKVKAKDPSNNEETAKWYNGLNDPRESTRRRDLEQKVAVPRRVKTPKEVPAVCNIERRRHQSDIIRQAQEMPDEPAPKPRKAVATEMEKRKLALIFQFKGGKALPDAGTNEPIDGQIPLSLITGKPNVSAAEKRAQQKAQLEFKKQRDEKSKLEREFDELFEEIKQIKSRIEYFDHKNCKTDTLSDLKEDLRMRMEEMKTINELLEMLRKKEDK